MQKFILRRYSRELILMGLIIFISACGSYIKGLTIFYLADFFDFSELEIGIFLSLVSIEIIFLYRKSSYFLNMFGKKKLYLYSNAIVSGIFLLEYYIYQSSVSIIFLFIALGFASIYSYVGKLFLIDYSTTDQRQEVFSITYMIGNIGGILGSTFSYSVYSVANDNIKYLFIIDALTTFAGFILVFLFFPNNKTLVKTEKHTKKREINYIKYLYLNNKATFYGITACTLMLVIITQIGFTLPLVFTDVLGFKTVKYIKIINGVCACTFVPITIFLGKKFSINSNIIIASLTSIVGFIMLLFSNTNIVYFIAIVLITLSEVIVCTNFDTFAVNTAPPQHINEAAKLYGFMNTIISIVAPFFFGAILSIEGFRSQKPLALEVLLIMSLFAAVTAIKGYSLVKNGKHDEEN